MFALNNDIITNLFLSGFTFSFFELSTKTTYCLYNKKRKPNFFSNLGVIWFLEKK